MLPVWNRKGREGSGNKAIRYRPEERLNFLFDADYHNISPLIGVCFHSLRLIAVGYLVPSIEPQTILQHYCRQ